MFIEHCWKHEDLGVLRLRPCAWRDRSSKSPEVVAVWDLHSQMCRLLSNVWRAITRCSCIALWLRWYGWWLFDHISFHIDVSLGAMVLLWCYYSCYYRCCHSVYIGVIMIVWCYYDDLGVIAVLCRCYCGVAVAVVMVVWSYLWMLLLCYCKCYYVVVVCAIMMIWCYSGVTIGVIMVLSASCEFWKRYNSEIIERPSDNTEIPEVRIEWNYNQCNSVEFKHFHFSLCL